MNTYIFPQMSIYPLITTGGYAQYRYDKKQMLIDLVRHTQTEFLLAVQTD
jgi:hypothetical protein